MMLTLLLVFAVIGAEAPPAHAVTGVILDARSHAPVYGATVSLPNGKRLGVAGKTGRFRVEIAEIGWPPSLIVAAPGLAAHSVALPHNPGDTDLKEITLSAAARIHVIVPPMFSGDKLNWRLDRLIAGRYPESSMKGVFPTGRTELTIDGLEAANYGLVIGGQGPLERVVTSTAVRAGESIDLPINITPSTLVLSVVSGEQPVSGAIVQFAQKDFQWRGIVTCNERGIASEEMWQGGDYWVSLVDHGRLAFERLAHLQSDTGTITWGFQIPAHRVKGRVVDSVTHQPLHGVEMTLRGTAPREGGLEGVQVMSDDDGRFEFRAVQEGPHALRSYLKGYRYDQPLHFKLEKDDGDYETEILLEQLINAHALIVVDSGGTPVAGADMFLATAEGMELLERTDSTGRVTLRTS
jgi:hypothetical protein